MVTGREERREGGLSHTDGCGVPYKSMALKLILQCKQDYLAVIFCVTAKIVSKCLKNDSLHDILIFK